MSPYQPNSDALLPPALAALPVDPLCPLPGRDGESFFASVILSFFSDLAFAFDGLGLGFAEGFGEAFAISVSFGVGFATGFGLTFGRRAGVALGFDRGVAVAVGFGVADGNSISLFVVLTTRFSCSTSSFFEMGSSTGVTCSGDGDSCFSESAEERSPASPNHTTLSEFDDTLAAKLQRISPAISATCASAIRTTFPQKRPLGVGCLCEGGSFAI